MHSSGSWQDLGELFRRDPCHQKHLTEIRGRLDVLGFGLIDPNRMAECIDEHLNEQVSHTKLLRQLLTHDSWVRSFGIDGVA